MDKNAIKKYAVWARNELIARVAQKALQYGITEENMVDAGTDSINGKLLTDLEKKQRQALIAQIKDKGFEQVMEEVAYTWFNRFSALRFMEVNGYLPTHVRVFTDEENNFKPQIITEAIHLELDGLDLEKVYAFKDADKTEELYKYLLITQCNALNKILPRMFQKISDYTELLFPDNLLREGSVIEQMIALIPEADWQDSIQIIGWLYQYYITEQNECVYDGSYAKSKIPKELVPAATTIYTPDWPVRYMVENSLGRLWIEGHPNDELKTKWKYYLEDVEQETEVRSTLVNIRKEYANISPEQIKCIDPCSGSGHICAYIFDVLIQIYETYGYSAHEAVRSIVKNNLYGLDIDERAAQLAYFTVMMKARQYDRRFLTRTDEAGNVDVPQPHLYAICESNGVDNYALDYFVNGDDSLKSAMNSIIREMQDAKEYGSIIKLSPVDFQSLYARFDEVYNDINISRETVLTEILQLVKVAEVLSQTYHVIVTNPPYLGSSRFSTKLEKYIKRNYVDEKSDLSMVMLKRALTRYVKRDGFVAFITTNSWMVLSRFEKLRNFILDGYSFESMVDFGTELFEGKVGHNPIVAWVNRASKMDKQFVAIRLVDYCYGRRDEKEKEFFNTTNYYYPKQSSFYAIPSAALTYSFSDKMISAFSKLPAVSDKATTRLGMTTADNNRFVRLWFEVESDKCLFNARNEDDVLAAGKKWVPYNKGGKYRKWYGNHDCVVNWENSGHEIKNFADEKGHIRSTVPNTDYYFQPCATWSKISSGAIAFRYRDYGSIFDVAGACLFTNRGLYQLMGFLNSNVADSILSVLSPTLNYEGSHIAALPVNEHMLTNSALEEIVKENIRISREDWDSFEFSWDFKKHPLVRGSSLREAYIDWEKECQCRFDKLKYNEEKINTMLIEEYGLQSEVSPRVEDRMVTVSKANKSADIRSLISYAVGCMFGRYSLDMDGVAYAGGAWDDSKYITFPADHDNIIPICDDEYFSDDIVGRFVKFVEVVYGTETLSDNLKFIAEALGGKGQPKDIIRDYFINNFYSDHCSACAFGTSGKRPIYWLFDSGKKNSFRDVLAKIK